MKNTKQLWGGLIILLFLGCDYEAINLEEFEIIVPSIEQEYYSQKPQTNWISRNFPQNCHWKPLSRVVDGDTLKCGEERVRLLGVDTPETKKEGTPVQPFGLEASKFTKDILADDAQVCLIFDTIGDKVDKYDRLLAYVFDEDGNDINGELLKTLRFIKNGKNILNATKIFIIFKRIRRSALFST